MVGDLAEFDEFVICDLLWKNWSKVVVSEGQEVVLGPLPLGTVLRSMFSLSDEGEEVCITMVSKEEVEVEGLAIGVVVIIGGRGQRGGR